MLDEGLTGCDPDDRSYLAATLQKMTAEPDSQRDKPLL